MVHDGSWLFFFFRTTRSGIGVLRYVARKFVSAGQISPSWTPTTNLQEGIDVMIF